MKTFWKLIFGACIVAALSCCSTNEEIIPTELNEDQKTSAALYADQFLTFQITASEMDINFTFHVAGNGGKVSINWGDGTIEKRTVTEYATFEHAYDEMKNYTVTISGDIKTITELHLNYEDIVIRDIHFSGLTNLKVVNFNLLGAGPRVVNFSRNKMLESVTLAGIEGLQDVILSTTNNIILIDISGENELTTPVVDRVIARIHDSVVNAPRPGFMNVSATWHQGEDDYSMIGPPSSYSINKLKKLRDVYGWNIAPEIQ